MKRPAYLSLGLVLLSTIILGFIGPGAPQELNTDEPKDTLYTFHNDVIPLLQANCNPCHFPGGKMYKELPFDDSTTVAKLGKKLNTRLKKRGQQLIINGWVELHSKNDKIPEPQ